jgi:hypothetical protein
MVPACANTSYSFSRGVLYPRHLRGAFDWSLQDKAISSRYLIENEGVDVHFFVGPYTLYFTLSDIFPEHAAILRVLG